MNHTTLAKANPDAEPSQKLLEKRIKLMKLLKKGKIIRKRTEKLTFKMGTTLVETTPMAKMSR